MEGVQVLTVCAFKVFYSDFTLYKGKHQHGCVLGGFLCTKKGALWSKSDITDEDSSEVEAFRPR